MNSLKRKLREHDPYYRIARRDPSQPPPRVVSLIAVSLGALIALLAHGVIATTLAWVAFVLTAELVARVVEWRRRRPPVT